MYYEYMIRKRRAVNTELLREIAAGRRVELSFHAGIDPSYLSKIINGHKGAPKEEVRIAIIEYIQQELGQPLQMDDLFPWTKAA